MSPEFVNTQETGISDDYVYLHCKCEYPLEFAWRFPRTNEEITFVCPKCKTKIGITAMKMNKPKIESEDAISRKAVLDLVVANHTELNGVNVVMYSPFYKDIKQLPSVTPQQNTGHWNRVTQAEHLVWECDKCKWSQRFNTNYCPNCGAKMTESEE